MKRKCGRVSDRIIRTVRQQEQIVSQLVSS